MGHPDYHHARKIAAQQYARHGWNVLPLTAGKKQPPLVKWKALETEMPTVDRVTRLFQRLPTPNIAIVTGAVSGAYACRSASASC